MPASAVLPAPASAREQQQSCRVLRPWLGQTAGLGPIRGVILIVNMEGRVMGYGIGSLLSVVVSVFARLVGLDRDRAFYSTVVIVVAHYYVLFAVMGGTTHALLVELGVMAAFVVVAVVGFKRNLWLIAAALVGHGVLDIFHAGLVTNAGVPEYWPAFCMAYDVGAGRILAGLLVRGKIPARVDGNPHGKESLIHA
jgi:hypothetical protein